MSNSKLLQSLVVVKLFEKMFDAERYSRELSRSRCRRTNTLVKHCGFEVTAEEMVAARDKIAIPTLRDILTADVHLSGRVRLLRLWFGHLRPLLRKCGK